MVDSTENARTGLVQRVQQHLHSLGRGREALGLTYVATVSVVALCGGALWVEWANLNLSVTELFPPMNGTSGAGAVIDTLPYSTVGGIVLADILLDKASVHWSERTRRLVDRLGVGSLCVFVLGNMALLPLSIWQANDPSGTGDGSPSMLTYVTFGAMLAGLFPMAVLGNFTLFSKLKALLGRIERVRHGDRELHEGRKLLREYQAAQAALREAEQQKAVIQTPPQVTEQFAAHASGVIGRVKGVLNRTLLLRFAAQQADASGGVDATDSPLLNHLPIDALEAHRDYLDGFSPAAIKQILA